MKKDFCKIFETSQVRKLDEYTIENEPITSADLMERAGREVVRKLLFFCSPCDNFNILVGPGNNGGDGYVIGRMLLEVGAKVRVYELHDGRGLSPDCALNRKRYARKRGERVTVKTAEDFAPEEGSWVVDAIFGAGLDRPVTGLAGEVIRRLNGLPNKVVAVDMPSGLMGEDNGGNDGAIVEADYTLTFEFPKLAFLFEENERYVGRYTVVRIGLHPDVLRDEVSRFYYMKESTVLARVLRPGKFAHKGLLGNTLLVAGSEELPGAALLAARGAIRSGTGLLTMHVPGALKELVHGAVPEALVEADVARNCFSGAYDFSRVQAVGIGPGMGTSGAAREALLAVLRGWKGKLVMDADALNMLAMDPGLLELVPEGAILTPHRKEFERLAGISENDFDRLNKLSTFASRHRVYVVLKGANTVVASPDGACYFNMTGNPSMAKGGSGDVLTGVIAGLLASGHSALDAAVIGVYVHGMAGDMAARIQGVRGVRAGDIADQLGPAWRMLEMNDNYYNVE